MQNSFTCPQCRALLKVRDESFVGQTIPCPECKLELLVVKSEADTLMAQPLRLPSAKPLPGKQTPDKLRPQKGQAEENKAASPTGTSSRTAIQTVGTDAANNKFDPTNVFSPPATGTKTPQVVAWSVAGLCLLLLIPFLLPKGAHQVDPLENVAKTKSDSPASGTSEVTQSAETSNGPSKAKSSQSGGSATSLANDKKSPQQNLVEQSLVDIGQWLQTDLQQRGHFAPGIVDADGVPLSQRFGWQALLAEKLDTPSGIQVSWKHGWNDPVNERFVRRPIATLQNKNVLTKTSEDKYPASHFVGMSGVGPDAATLAVDHPRAGIFGEKRKTRTEDVTDGLSNTMAVAGVETDLGSWAHGTVSYRAFTREPYINGPDGFGTGQPKSMLVLMADGSVREMSDQTDPRILRRMAAMADGLALDSQVPGEPGEVKQRDKSSTSPAIANAGVNNPPQPQIQATSPDKSKATVENKTPDVPTIVEKKPLDIASAMSRKVNSFDQQKPAAAYLLLLQVEELAGVPIEYDRKALGSVADRLDKQITLRKKNASLEELLTDILQQIGLKKENGKFSIQIIE